MSGTIRYSIRPYDTIWMLAQVFNTTVDSIMELNPGIEPRNLQIGQVITIMPGYQYYAPYNGSMPPFMDNNASIPPVMDNNAPVDMNSMMCDLSNYFRMLWEQHAIWTWFAIIGMLRDLPESEQITQRLLRNAEDFADAFRSFYGDETAQNFENLLTNHINLAGEVINAAMTGDMNAAQDAEQRWYANANQIAEFLGGINQFWKTEDWEAMFNEHLDLLRMGIDDVMAQNYEESINDFDDIEAQALEMADMMAEGLMSQFPA